MAEGNRRQVYQAVTRSDRGTWPPGQERAQCRGRAAQPLGDECLNRPPCFTAQKARASAGSAAWVARGRLEPSWAHALLSRPRMTTWSPPRPTTPTGTLPIPAGGGNVPYDQARRRSQRRRTALGSAMTLEQLFLSELALIERIIAWVSARHYLRGADAEDFASIVKLRFIENDYEILSRFEGRSSLKTYLAAVINRVYLDY